MRLMHLILLLVTFSAFADEVISLKNDREGSSYYQSSSTTRSINRALKTVSAEDIQITFNEILAITKERELCAYNINESLVEGLKKINPKFKDLPGAIHQLRVDDEIDDMVVKILLKAEETASTKVYYSRSHDHNRHSYLPRDRKILQQMMEVIATFKTRHLERSCFDEAYRTLYSELSKILKQPTQNQLKDIFIEAYEDRIIDFEIYELLEKARDNKLHEGSLDLKNYYSKIKNLRIQYPLRDPTERSDFSAGLAEGIKMSRRQRLLEGYSDLQIIMMGNIIKKLRSRLESPRIEIMIYDHESLQEVIPLEPMERFRFAIKILRKEMLQLSMHTYFSGRQPSYMDLMTAAYETGIIPAVELEEVAGLQEIWNPKKSFWDKAGVWVRMFSGVATMVIPPPYGFIPALALVVIESTVGKKDTKSDNMDLF